MEPIRCFNCNNWDDTKGEAHRGFCSIEDRLTPEDDMCGEYEAKGADDLCHTCCSWHRLDANYGFCHGQEDDPIPTSQTFWCEKFEKRGPQHARGRDEWFESVVALDVQNKATDLDRRWLREKAQLNRWRQQLVKTKQDIETQFVSRKADLLLCQQDCKQSRNWGREEYVKKKTEHEVWRKGAVRFKQGVEERLTEVKRLLKESNVEIYNEPRADNRTPYIIRIAEALERRIYNDSGELIDWTPYIKRATEALESIASSLRGTKGDKCNGMGEDR